jgi:hypothetical protein
MSLIIAAHRETTIHPGGAAMARKKVGTKMPVATETKTKPVRLDLTPEDHHLLRKRAADANMSMAAFARMMLLKLLKGGAK